MSEHTFGRNAELENREYTIVELHKPGELHHTFSCTSDGTRVSRLIVGLQSIDDTSCCYALVHVDAEDQTCWVLSPPTPKTASLCPTIIVRRMSHYIIDQDASVEVCVLLLTSHCLLTYIHTCIRTCVHECVGCHCASYLPSYPRSLAHNLHPIRYAHVTYVHLPQHASRMLICFVLLIWILRFASYLLCTRCKRVGLILCVLPTFLPNICLHMSKERERGVRVFCVFYLPSYP